MKPYPNRPYGVSKKPLFAYSDLRVVFVVMVLCIIYLVVSSFVLLRGWFVIAYFLSILFISTALTTRNSLQAAKKR